MDSSRSTTRSPGAELRWQAASARIALALALAALAVRVLGARRAHGWLLAASARMPAAGPPPADVHALARRAAARVAAVAARLPGSPRCLVRSLALCCALRRHGVASELRLGVRHSGGFEAHAWVEVDGVVVNDAQDVSTHYARFGSALSRG